MQGAITMLIYIYTQTVKLPVTGYIPMVAQKKHLAVFPKTCYHKGITIYGK